MPGQVISDAGRSGSTSHTLLERVKLRDPQAWQRFASIYGPIVYRWSVNIGLQPSDAADVTQEVFAALHNKLDTFRRQPPDYTFRGWLYSVTRNKVRDHFRARKNRPEALGGETAQWQVEQIPELPPDEESSPGSTADLARRGLHLIQNEFEPSTWQAFWQSTVEGRHPADVAADLGRSVAAVYQAKYRVLKYLRRELEGLTP